MDDSVRELVALGKDHFQRGDWSLAAGHLEQVIAVPGGQRPVAALEMILPEGNQLPDGVVHEERLPRVSKGRTYLGGSVGLAGCGSVGVGEGSCLSRACASRACSPAGASCTRRCKTLRSFAGSFRLR